MLMKLKCLFFLQPLERRSVLNHAYIYNCTNFLGLLWSTFKALTFYKLMEKPEHECMVCGHKLSKNEIIISLFRVCLKNSPQFNKPRLTLLFKHVVSFKMILTHLLCILSRS